MLRTQISLEPETYERARAEADRLGISFAELVRRAIARLLAGRDADHPWSRFAGAIEDAGSDASSSVDTVVYGRERP